MLDSTEIKFLALSGPSITVCLRRSWLFTGFTYTQAQLSGFLLHFAILQCENGPGSCMFIIALASCAFLSRVISLPDMPACQNANGVLHGPMSMCAAA